MRLPGWLINQAIKLVALVFLKSVANKAENLPDDYKKVMEEKDAENARLAAAN